MVLRRFLFAALCVLAALPCGAQQGAGGFGGGFGGTMGGPSREADLQTATNILTPGQQTEWAITVKDGETVIASATTTNFDPAIQLVDADGKVLAENDDIALGVQDARLLYRFAKGGSYKLLVKAFKGAGGGQFTFTQRRFLATDIALGQRLTSTPTPSHLQYYRIAATAGQTLLLNLQRGNTANVLVFSPTGEKLESQRRATSTVFRAETAGDYYARVNSATAFALTVAAAKVAPLTLGAAKSAHTLSAGGMDIWTFEGTEGDFVRIHAKAEGIRVSAQLDILKTKDSLAGDALEALDESMKAQGELVVFLKQTGTYELTVNQPLGLAADYTLTSTRTVPSWNTKDNHKETLRVGGADYYLIDGKAGEILRVGGQSDQFDIVLELYNLQGEPLSSNDDGAANGNALMTVLLSKTGKYLLRVHSFGFGGGGAYLLKRAPDPVRPLMLGTKGVGSLGVDVSDIWSYAGKAGQTLILSVRSSDFDTFVRVFGPDGIELASNDDGGDGTNSLLSFTLPLDGTYTIWVSGKSGTGKYTIKLSEAE